MDGNDGYDLEESLLVTLARTDLRDRLVEFSEVALDSLFQEGVARDIPIIGTLVSPASGAMTIRDRLFAKKVLRFLVALDTIPQEEREEQIGRLAADAKERRRLGEHLFLLIDRLNDMGKPALLARAFQALLEGKINRVQFQGLANAIDIILPEYFEALKSHMGESGYISTREPDDAIAHCLQCGIVTIVLEEIDTTARYGDGSITLRPAGHYVTSNLGYLFHAILLAE